MNGYPSRAIGGLDRHVRATRVIAVSAAEVEQYPIFVEDFAVVRLAADTPTVMALSSGPVPEEGAPVHVHVIMESDVSDSPVGVHVHIDTGALVGLSPFHPLPFRDAPRLLLAHGLGTDFGHSGAPVLDDHDRVVGLVSRMLPGSAVRAVSGLTEEEVDGEPAEQTLLSSMFCLPMLSGVVMAPRSLACSVDLADDVVFDRLVERYLEEHVVSLGGDVRYTPLLTPYRAVDPPRTAQSQP